MQRSANAGLINRRPLSMDGRVPRAQDALEWPLSMDGRVPRAQDALEWPLSMDGRVLRAQDALERSTKLAGCGQQQGST